jgi:hypothetical protein
MDISQKLVLKEYKQWYFQKSVFEFRGFAKLYKDCFIRIFLFTFAV